MSAAPSARSRSRGRTRSSSRTCSRHRVLRSVRGRPVQVRVHHRRAPGRINDPVLLRLAEDRFWLSLADSDVLLWCKGLARNAGLDVRIHEPDVAPLQVQGPKSREVMTDLFGPEILDVPYYFMVERELNGMRVVISRTGYTGELGYELYLYDASRDGLKLWDALIEAGAPHGLSPIGPSHIRDRGRHPRARLRHDDRGQPLPGRLRLQVDGRARAGDGRRPARVGRGGAHRRAHPAGGGGERRRDEPLAAGGEPPGAAGRREQAALRDSLDRQPERRERAQRATPSRRGAGRRGRDRVERRPTRRARRGASSRAQRAPRRARRAPWRATSNESRSGVARVDQRPTAPAPQTCRPHARRRARAAGATAPRRAGQAGRGEAGLVDHQQHVEAELGRAARSARPRSPRASARPRARARRRRAGAMPPPARSSAIASVTGPVTCSLTTPCSGGRAASSRDERVPRRRALAVAVGRPAAAAAGRRRATRAIMSPSSRGSCGQNGSS